MLGWFVCFFLSWFMILIVNLLVWKNSIWFFYFLIVWLSVRWMFKLFWSRWMILFLLVVLIMMWFMVVILDGVFFCLVLSCFVVSFWLMVNGSLCVDDLLRIVLLFLNLVLEVIDLIFVDVMLGMWKVRFLILFLLFLDCFFSLIVVLVSIN